MAVLKQGHWPQRQLQTKLRALQAELPRDCMLTAIYSILSSYFVMLQDMPRPFTMLKELDMDELAKEIIADA